MGPKNNSKEVGLPEEAVVRNYLLGRLEASSEPGSRQIVDYLDDCLLSGNFSEQIGVIEDEIVEDYLEGTLRPQDTQAFEAHFLRPPERQEKLRVARLLDRRLKMEGQTKEHGNLEESQIEEKSTLPSSHWRRHRRSYAELAAVLLLCAVFAGYLADLRSRFRSEMTESNRQVAESRQISTSRLETAGNLQQPVLLNHFQTQVILRRGVEPAAHADAPLPELPLGAATKSIQVEISLPRLPFETYDVRLQNKAGQSLWSGSEPRFLTDADRNSKSSAGAILFFEVPSHDLLEGEYTFVISHASNPLVTYSFYVKSSHD
ncbi:MAG TPA: hypothetical protein VKZ53_21280 [Candidatus Angelobacter sp.]|nr:hypothetical protein [Candidatus Angelobacter sp.]